MPIPIGVKAWWTKLARSWATRAPRQLRLCETLALGDRQSLAVVEVGQQRFLIGRTHTSVALLAPLSGTASPAQALASPSTELAAKAENREEP